MKRKTYDNKKDFEQNELDHLSFIHSGYKESDFIKIYSNTNETTGQDEIETYQEIKTYFDSFLKRIKKEYACILILRIYFNFTYDEINQYYYHKSRGRVRQIICREKLAFYGYYHNRIKYIKDVFKLS